MHISSPRSFVAQSSSLARSSKSTLVFCPTFSFFVVSACFTRSAFCRIPSVFLACAGDSGLWLNRSANGTNALAVPLGVTTENDRLCTKLNAHRIWSLEFLSSAFLVA